MHDAAAVADFGRSAVQVNEINLLRRAPLQAEARIFTLCSLPQLRTIWDCHL